MCGGASTIDVFQDAVGRVGQLHRSRLSTAPCIFHGVLGEPLKRVKRNNSRYWKSCEH
jgi:hypothetical protein